MCNAGVIKPSSSGYLCGIQNNLIQLHQAISRLKEQRFAAAERKYLMVCTIRIALRRPGNLALLSAQSRSQFSDDLIRHLSNTQQPQQLDSVLEQLDDRVKESQNSRVEKGWRISRGPFSVLHLVSESENEEALNQQQVTMQCPEPVTSLDCDRESVACMDDIDWSWSVPEGNMASQTLLADAPVGEIFNYSFNNATYSPRFEGKSS